MAHETELKRVVPILPSSDIERDVAWYGKQAGFNVDWHDDSYAFIYRDNIILPLQWHAGTVDDPLLGGSAIRIFVDQIDPIFKEFVGMGTVNGNKLVKNTPWKTNEFGFYDLNKNSIHIVQDIE